MTASEPRLSENLRNGHYDGRPTTEPTYACPRCKDAGWLRYDVLPDQKDFGGLVECSCGLVARRRIERAAAKAGVA
jgi:hypothetical protein